MKNYGVIIKPIRKDAWICGMESGIVYQERTGGSWTIYLPEGEIQANNLTDFMDCVSFSATNSVEVQLNYLIANKFISEKGLAKLKNWGYIKNGSFNCADRFTAKMSNTTEKGNSAWDVWNSIRHDGLVPEDMWPLKGTFNWNDYYAEIPQEVKDYGKHFLEVIDPKYEWVILDGWNMTPKQRQEILNYQLKQSPIQLLTPVCNGWSIDNPVKSCGSSQTGHATLLYSLEDYYKDFDSYSPFKKNLALDYPVHYGMKGVMVEKVVEPEKPPTQHNFSINMAYGERSQEVVFLQDKLKDLGYFKKTVLSTGGYFSITKDAVYRFQLENVNMSWYEKYVLKGSKVGPKTRFQLNIS